MAKTKVSDIARHREVMRKQARDRVKLAELGGDGQDVPFEQAFSNLAHAYLRDKAPGLLDHEVGFQLLDRNQENTKAIGVFGFKVGSNWIYAPVFFLNGDLKGHELLYLKNQDMFVPLKENWLNYILNRKPNILGEGVDKDYRSSVLQPDLQQLSQSPGKYASAKPTLREMTDAVMPVFADAATFNTKQAFEEIGKRLNLVDFLKNAGAKTVHVFMNTLRECPQLAKDVEDFHGVEAITAAIKTALAKARVKSAGSIMDEPAPVRSQIRTRCIMDDTPDHPIKTGSLKVITHDLTVQTELPEGITEEDQEKLLRDRVLIKDDRKDDEVSKAYHVQVEQKLTNPTETGIYQVLVKSGDFEKCLVLVHPYGPAHKMDFVTIVRLDGEKNWANVPGNQVWVGAHMDEEWDKWLKDQKEVKSLSKGRSRHIIISPSGEATVPFSVNTEYGEEGTDVKVYEVDFDDYNAGNLMASYQTSSREQSDPLRYDRWNDGQRIHLNAKKGQSLKVNRGDVFVPEGSKIIEVRHDKTDDMTEEERKKHYNQCVPCGPSGETDPPPIRPGNILDAQLSIMQKTAALTIYNDGAECEINQQRMPPLTGFISLVRDHGFREPVARELLKQAMLKRKVTVQVKYASPYLRDSQVSAPAIPEPMMGSGEMMGANVPTQLQTESSLPIDRPQTDREVYNPNTTLDRREVGKIRRATQTGQKEIFDTAMVGSMLKAVRDDTMVDQYLGDLAKGMDRLGRIMFMFYWHGDKFADRYGKSDMPELEDSLRNSFEAVGDVLMFLKQKTIEPYPEENDVGTDLGSVAGA